LLIAEVRANEMIFPRRYSLYEKSPIRSSEGTVMYFLKNPRPSSFSPDEELTVPLIVTRFDS
jgi:hypothetical protein